ncbi:MAG: hypothetical protein NTY37_12340 [Methanothrix sp.]|nr:hypothetical protein [Methanothrix sp.]
MKYNAIELYCMHRTPSDDRRQALKRSALELAGDARALHKAARAPASRPWGKGRRKARRKRPWQRPRPSSSRPGWRT